jgi:uncharacterized protein
VLIILPPSETKRDGGNGAPLDVGALSRPRLHPVRRRLVRTVRALARDPEASRRALKLGSRQDAEIERNLRLTRSATMPAIDRYTGVLYDALDAPGLDEPARAFAGEHLVIHSALFGLVGALDPIPAYRLSHDSRLPDESLREAWRKRISGELAAASGLIIDLRSEGYAQLGPLAQCSDAAVIRVVTGDGSGRRRSVNHFNKASKGRLARALLSEGEDLETAESLMDWAQTAGFVLERTSSMGGALELQLVV